MERKSETSRVPRESADYGPNERLEAERVLWATLGTESVGRIEQFAEQLDRAVEHLPRYRQLEEQLKPVPYDQVFLEVFRAMRRSSDPIVDASDKPDNGVLITSMREGIFECAGRVLVASTYLRDRGIEHAVVNVVGHTFLLAEMDADTLAYNDPNQEVYFTFPSSALEGYAGNKAVAECRLLNYTPREKDQFEGCGPVYDTLLVSPPASVTLLTYLENVKAVGARFEKRTSKAFNDLRDQIAGKKNEVQLSFEAKLPQLRLAKKLEQENDDQVVREMIKQSNGDETILLQSVTAIFTAGEGKRRFPYLQNVTQQKCLEAAREWLRKKRRLFTLNQENR